MKSDAGRPLAAKVRGISKSFGVGEARIKVLKEIDLDVRCGDITMLVGPSGCGKTTLISIIAGTLAADEGELNVFGNDLRSMPAAAITAFRAKNIGFIFQAFNLIPTLTCAENVSVPLLIQGVSASKAEKKAKEVLKQVGLGDRIHHRPAQLSGGQQQRVAIARALIHEPRLIICDEPTAALDATNGHVVMELFDHVARGNERAVLIVTHDNRIFHHADRIASMNDGQVVEVYDVDENHPPPQHLHVTEKL